MKTGYNPLDEEKNRMALNSLIAFAALDRHLGKRKRGQEHDDEGTISCPVCSGGTLHYRRSAYNGHISAKCTTEKCVEFMQ